MGARLQRCQPCLDGHVRASASVTLPPPDELKCSSVITAVGGNEASPSEQPSGQGFVLSFDRGLQRSLIPDVGGCRVPHVEGQPRSKASQMSSD